METFDFLTSDKERLFVRRCRADQEKKAAVFIAGVESHGGWYEDTLNYLAEQGITSYFLDRRGSGKSGGFRGDIPSLRRLIQDLKEFTASVAGDHPGKPLILAAISWGAKWAAAFWRERHPYQQLLLITPGFYRKVDLPLRLKAGAVAALLAAPRTQFALPIFTESFTRNPTKLGFLAEDPGRLHQVSARFLKVNAELDLVIRGFQGIYPQRVCVFQAGQETIVDNPRSLGFVREHFFDLKTFTYPEAFHTLEFESKIPYRSDLAVSVLD